MQLAAARLFVRDLAGAQAFYQQHLGMRLKSGSVDLGFCVFDAGAVDLVLEPVAAAAAAAEQSLVGRFSGLSFMVADIQSRQEELQAQGVPFEGKPEKQSWGGWLSTFVDPAGNRLQLVQYPG